MTLTRLRFFVSLWCFFGGVFCLVLFCDCFFSFVVVFFSVFLVACASFCVRENWGTLRILFREDWGSP